MVNQLKELNQFKINHETKHCEWLNKVDASAGDVQDTLRLLSKENHTGKNKIEELETELKRIKKECGVYKSLVSSSNLGLEFDQLQEMI